MHVNSLRSFAEALYLLLCGCGVGFGLSSRHMNKLPDLVSAKHKTGTIITYVVQDDIEGWADSVEALLMCYFKNTPYTGRKIVFDYSKIRAEGTPLKTGGGKAPGYKGLKRTHEKIKALLDFIIEDKKQRRLKTINAYDILMHCADAVLSGGIRRSACSVIFELSDKDMMEAKGNFKVQKIKRFVKDEDSGLYHGKVKIDSIEYDISDMNQWDYDTLKKDSLISWFYVQPQRARSNNSVLLYRDSVTFDQFKSIVQKTRECGEPGFVFANEKTKDVLFNPCVTADTLVSTTDGTIKIIDLVNKFNAGETILVRSFNLKINKIETNKVLMAAKTRENAELIKLTIVSDGIEHILRLTPDHKVYVINHGWIKASDLKKDQLVIVAESKSGISSVKSIELLTYTEAVYDISVENNHNFFANGILVHNCFEISFIPIDEAGHSGVQVCNLTTQNGGKITSKEIFKTATKAATIIGTLQAAYTDFEYLSNTSKEITEKEALLGVSITGMMDNPAILLNPDNQREMAEYSKEVNEEWAKKLGISPCARTTCIKPEGCMDPDTIIKTSIGDKTLRQLFELNELSEFKLSGIYKNEKTFFKPITQIYVYDENNTKQLITELYVNGISPTLDVSFNDGTSVKCTKNHQFLTINRGWIRADSLEINDVIKSYGLNETRIVNIGDGGNRLTLDISVENTHSYQLKNGTVVHNTSSIILETASGIHPAHAKKYIRRIQCNKMDPVYKFIKANNPHACEESVWSANKTDDVVSFPITSNPDAMVKSDLTAIKHLEIIKSTQQNWVIPGTRDVSKGINNNVSCTVIVGDNEWEDVQKYIYDNKEYFTAVALIPNTGDKLYKQAPNEAVTTQEDEVKFEELMKKWKSLNFKDFKEEDDNTKLQQEAACAGGGCEVKAL